MKKHNVIILVIVLVVVGLGGMVILAAGGLVWYMYQSDSEINDQMYTIRDQITNVNGDVPCVSGDPECMMDEDALYVNENENTNIAADNGIVDATASGYVDVVWHDTPIERSPSEYGFTVPVNEYAYESAVVTSYYTVYEVGTVESAPYAGQPFLIVQRTCDGPCGYSHYRVIDDRSGSGNLVLLRTISNQLFDGDEQYFQITDGYDVADLHLPSQLTLNVDGQDLLFKAEDFSPAVLFDEYTGDEYAGEYQARYEHPLYGTLYESMESGYYMVRLSDGTNKIYALEMPFNMVETNDSGSYRPVVDLYVFNENGAVTVQGEYTPVEWASCPPRSYAFNREVTVDDLEQIGTSYNYVELQDEPVYKFKDPNYYKLHEKYDFLYEPGYGYDEYVSNNPILLAQDTVGRWMELYNTNYQPLAEMGCFYINSAL